MVKIIVTQSGSQQAIARLREQAKGDEVVVVDREGRPLDGGDLSDAEVFMRSWSPPTVTETVMKQAPRLKWMHTPSAGLDQVLFPALVESDIVLTNSSGVHAMPISEWVILYVLAAAKRLPELLAAQRERRWAQDLKLQELTDKTLLILGYGAIGREVAKRALPFGMKVIAARSGSKGKDDERQAGVEIVYGSEAWRGVLPRADFVVVSLPLTEQTRGVVNAAAFTALKPTAWFINIARGEIADEDALLRALQEGRIAGAGLDAFGEEPLPSNHPLYSLPESKVLLTPHISWNSPQVGERTLDLFLENLRRYKSGEPLLNVVDKRAGY
ncbi:MAG: D-2-hydroxyacid dehydrogenase [Candidatus Chloroheliales bacterium]|nr:MAG: D-2-hydroxyacid dehydrogenase [Chloroflexota bacterium]